MGKQKKTARSAEQLSIFEQVLEKLAKGGDIHATSDELIKIIEHLVDVKNETIKKEETERKLQKEMEAKRKAEEERMQHDLHIQSVTSMDLPLDWENAFSDDSRTQGVHVDSISDALILSLSNLAKVDIERYRAIIKKLGLRK